LASLVRGIRAVESALGDGQKRPVPSEADTAAVARKSLVAACDIAAGATLDSEMIAIRRPGNGLSPASSHLLVGRAARAPIRAGALLTQEMFT
jgi:sialic acid synthase SpsE